MPREQWPLEVHGIDTIIDDGINVEDLDVKQLLISILTELKKIEYHLYLGTDTELKDQDVGE